MNLFYNSRDGYKFKQDKDNDNSILYCPLNVDTEYYSSEINTEDYKQFKSKTITVQIKGINQEDKGIIYSHKDCENIARHSLITSDFAPLQYLYDNGYDVSLNTNLIKNRTKINEYPLMVFCLYAHFAIADFIRLFDEDLRVEIRKLILNTKNNKNKGNGIKHERRLRTFHQIGANYKPYIKLPRYISLDDTKYLLCIEVIDSIGLAGNISYLNLGVLTSVPIEDKKLLSKEDLEKMNIAYQSKPNDFDDYALNDLKVSDMVEKFDILYNSLRNELGLDYCSTRLTIGSTVSKIIEDCLIKLIGNKKDFLKLTQECNPQYIINNYKDTRLFCVKVDGGRCFNNRPTEVYIEKQGCSNFFELLTSKDCIVDADIDGAYGYGLLSQELPLGIPKSIEYPLNTSNNYMTLREFLCLYKDELVDRLWVMRVTSIKKLTYSQDLIASWIRTDDNSIFNNHYNVDDIGLDYSKNGYIKIFENEITLGLITSDILDWIDNICSEKQKKELYDNLMVISAIWYDKNQKTENVFEVIESFNDFYDYTDTEYVNNEKIKTEVKNNKWCSYSIGDLFLKKLIKKRKEYKKDTAENTFYKLIINTVYGVLASRFFNVSNPVVGNNITAKCRVFAWYMEKGLNAFQTITDGVTFELNNVCYPVTGRRLTANNLVKGYSKIIKKRQWITKPLEINTYIKLIENDTEILVKRSDFINQLVINLYSELQNKNIDIRGLIKDGKNEYELIINSNFYNYVHKYFNEIIKNKNCELYIDIGRDILTHLRNIFPNVKILHDNYLNIDNNIQKGLFNIGIKFITKSIVLHGNADYSFDLENTYTIPNEGYCEIEKSKLIKETNEKKLYKMRGYRDNKCYNYEDDNEIIADEYELLDNLDIFDFSENLEVIGINIPKTFLDNLRNNPHRVTRLDTFIQESIIKCGDYIEKQSSLQHKNYDIGYTILTPRLLTELTLTQFLYPTKEDFEYWYKKHQKAKMKLGQGLESNWINEDEDESLNYQKMIIDIADKINNQNKITHKQQKHPHKEKLETLKTKLDIIGYK